MLRTMSHEMIHMAKQMSPGYFERYSDFIFDNFLSENADELIFRRQRQYEKANNGKKLSYNEAMEEVVADASEMFLKGFLGLKVELGNQAGEGRVDMETVTENLQKPKYKGVLRVLGNVIERMKRKISAFKRAWNGAQAKTEEGKAVSAGDAKAYEQAQQMFNELILRASANYKLLKDGKWESDSEKSEKASIRGGAEGGAEITEKDIAVLRDIPRKSINNFTSEEIQKTEVWAKRFYQELGTKSPYFRAWFGDWRANDTEKINIVSVPTIDIKDATLEYGDYHINDTGWDVYAGRTLKDDTTHHSGGERINVKSLNSIESILKNAVLFDTVVSENNANKKAKYTAFLHKLYTPITYKNSEYIAVTTVEEYYNESVSDVSRRAYNLKSIKIEPADGRLEKISTSPMSDTGSTISISDLYSLVKSNDKNFKENPASKVVNEDGTPKVVYHGTTANFTTFKPSNGALGKGIYFSDSKDFAKGYTYKDGAAVGTVMECYLDIKNPYIVKYADNYDTEALREKGYDGILHEATGMYVAFSPEQIKSATDNIGTFDSNNPDIRYSTRNNAEDVKTAEEYFGTTYNVREAGQNEVRNGNLVRIKNRSTQTSELTADVADSYNLNASKNSIIQNSGNVNSQSKNSSKENISDVLTDSTRTFADSLTEPTKYQTRDGSATDYVTSRLALADAFEQIATNQRERNWAARYRERAEELAGYNTRLRELWKDYFTKGHSAAERAEIRTQIRSLTQKIQTADGGGSKEKQGVKNTLFLNLQAAYSSDL